MSSLWPGLFLFLLMLNLENAVWNVCCSYQFVIRSAEVSWNQCGSSKITEVLLLLSVHNCFAFNDICRDGLVQILPLYLTKLCGVHNIALDIIYHSCICVYKYWWCGLVYPGCEMQ